MMYVSANEKAVSLNLHRYTTGAGQVTPSSTSAYGALAPSTDLFCGKSINPTVGLCTLNSFDP
jgi:hypothetical protein